MGALKNLLGSEKGLVGLLLIVAVSVLAGFGKVTFEDWQEYTLYVFGVYVGGKTIQGVAATIAGAKRDTPAALPAEPSQPRKGPR